MVKVNRVSRALSSRFFPNPDCVNHFCLFGMTLNKPLFCVRSMQISPKTMKTIKKIGLPSLLFILVLSFQNAFSQGDAVKKVQDLNAADKTVYYNLEKGIAVDAADTLKTGWDISFQRTKIELQAAACGQLLENSAFEKIAQAPSTGYLPGRAAIPNGSGKGWYLYNMDNHIISPIAGKVILVRAASGKYYKLVIDSYYKQGADGSSGYYTFRFAEIGAGN